jgi:hypothetical protein
MPLRDHFRPPLDEVHSWDELHGMWPAMIVRELIKVLPEPYFAAPGVHLGTLYEVDVATHQATPSAEAEFTAGAGPGGAAIALYAPPEPTLVLEPQLPEQDVYEVRIYDSRRRRRLVAAIELISPSNKDRPESRAIFTGKLAVLLKNNVCVSIVDVVTTHTSNMYTELLRFLKTDDPQLKALAPASYAATLRLRYGGGRRLMDNWYYPLTVGRPLPVLPIWLSENLPVQLDLESSYEETCQSLRIA